MSDRLTLELTFQQTAAITSCIQEDEYRRAADEERYGPSAARSRLRGDNVATLVAIWKQMGVSGSDICRRRRSMLGFES